MIEYLAQQAGLRPRRGIYSVAVVLWLMMVQRLQHQGSLASSGQEKLVGPITTAREWKVAWQPSRADRAKWGTWPAAAEVRGRLIAVRIGRGKSKTWLYLFTTLELSAARLAALYDRRWNIETDLRSLKQTVRPRRLTAKTVDMMEKELLLAVSAYNLVRAVMGIPTGVAPCGSV